MKIPGTQGSPVFLGGSMKIEKIKISLRDRGKVDSDQKEKMKKK